MRKGGGHAARLIRFWDSPKAPSGISESSVLDYSFLRNAVAAGDDMVSFDYDIWTVEVATGQKRRLTKGFSSRYPAKSPGANGLPTCVRTASAATPCLATAEEISSWSTAIATGTSPALDG